METNVLINLILWMVTSMLMILIIFIYFFFTRMYNNFQQLKINSYNDVIDSSSVNKIINYYQIVFKLENYQVKYQPNDQKRMRTIVSSTKFQKEINLSKIIFLSVGYEIDYIISSLWFISKINDRNKTVITYNFLIKFMHTFWLILFFCSYFIGTTFFSYLSLNVENTRLDFFLFLWYHPIELYLPLVIFALIFLNYFFALKLKEQVEQLFTSEIKTSFEEVFSEYFEDFQIARYYSQENKLPIIPLFKSRIETPKWLGSFSKY